VRVSQPIALREVMLLAPHMLAGLPLPTTLRVSASHGVLWHATTSRLHYAELRQQHELVFTGRELGVMAVAVEQGRGTAAALAGWLQQRRDNAEHPLTIVAALGGAQLEQTPVVRWSLERVLKHLLCELEAVAVEEEGEMRWLAENDDSAA
jgi:hypothetical protein